MQMNDIWAHVMICGLNSYGHSGLWP